MITATVAHFGQNDHGTHFRIDQRSLCAMAGATINTRVLARLFEQSTRALHSSGHRYGLFPAQWTALRYFSTADPSQCTAISLARYQGMAFGPVSRTVRTLITKSLLRRAGLLGKGRAEILEVSDAGRVMLSQDPIRVVVDTLDQLSDDEKIMLVQTLEQILVALKSAPDLYAD